jgi:hypothetical protein
VRRNSLRISLQVRKHRESLGNGDFGFQKLGMDIFLETYLEIKVRLLFYSTFSWFCSTQSGVAQIQTCALWRRYSLTLILSSSHPQSLIDHLRKQHSKQGHSRTHQVTCSELGFRFRFKAFSMRPHSVTKSACKFVQVALQCSSDREIGAELNWRQWRAYCRLPIWQTCKRAELPKAAWETPFGLSTEICVVLFSRILDGNE